MIVAKGKVQAFIATLVMMLLLRGVTMVYTNGSPVNTGFTDVADTFGWFGIGRPLGVPTPIWIMAIVFIAARYMLHHTRRAAIFMPRRQRSGDPPLRHQRR